MILNRLKLMSAKKISTEILAGRDGEIVDDQGSSLINEAALLERRARGEGVPDAKTRPYKHHSRVLRHPPIRG
jgi:hypothetical protein